MLTLGLLYLLHQPEAPSLGTSLLGGLQHFRAPQVEEIICIRVKFQSIFAVLPERSKVKRRASGIHFWQHLVLLKD